MAAEPRWSPNRVGRLHRSAAEHARCSHGMPRSPSTTPTFNHIHFLGEKTLRSSRERIRPINVLPMSPVSL